MKKITLHLSIIIMFIFACRSVSAQAWDGTTAIIWTQGDGLSPATAYEISTPENLAYLAQQVNAGTGYAGIYFKMTGNLDLGNFAWTRIGSSQTNSFKGVFDGLGYSVSNLFINRTGNNTAADGTYGLFGYVYGGTIRNLGISSGSVEGFTMIGSLAGVLNTGTIEYCYNKSAIKTARAGGQFGGLIGTLVAGTVQYCYNAGNVLEDRVANNNIGGIVGQATAGTIQFCFNTGLVSGNNGTAGIAGSGGLAVIHDCYNTGEVVGVQNFAGITGNISTTETPIYNCYTTGFLNLSVRTGNYGAIIGANVDREANNCYYDSQIIVSSLIQKGQPKITSEMLGSELETVLGGTNWIFDGGLYPGLKNINSSDDAILSLTPFVLVTEDNVSEIKSNFTVERSSGVNWTSSDPGIIDVEGSIAIILRKNTDRDVLLTATLGSSVKRYELKVLSNFFSAQNYKPLLLNEIKAKGWIYSQIERDWTSGTSSVLWNNLYLPTTLGSIKELNSNVPNKFKDSLNRWVYSWNYGEMEGNLADAAVRASFLVDNAALKSRFKLIMDFMVDSIAATQYVDSLALTNYNGGELFGQTCMERAMLAYYEYSGEQKYYDAVKLLVDKTIIQWNNKFDNGETYFGRDFDKKGAMNHSITYGDILEYLFRKTGDRKYVDFAFRFYNDFTTFVDRVGEDDDGGADDALDMLADSTTLFKGHAPHTAEGLRMPVWLSTFTNDSTLTIKQTYNLALENIPLKLNKSLSPTKGLVTDTALVESINEKCSSGNLPYEYCSLTETLNSLSSICQKYGDVESAESSEVLFFNAAQGARFSDGKANTYLIADNVEKASINKNWRYQYSALHSIRCCNLNAARIAPYYVANMWMKNQSETELIALLHGPSSVTTKMNDIDVTVISNTNYPFENTIRYLVTCDAPVNFSLLIRKPDWSKQPVITADGATVSMQNGFIKIEKQWGTSQQTITIQFDENIMVKKLDNADSHDFYVQRGALIYTYPFENDKTFEQIRITFPGYNHWEITIPSAVIPDYYGMKMLSDSRLMFGRDSSFLRYRLMSPYNANYPYDASRGKIIGRFVANGNIVERSLIPVGCANTRRTTFSEGDVISPLVPVTIELVGELTVNRGQSIQLSAVVRDQHNDTIANPQITWSSSGGTITQNGLFTATTTSNLVYVTLQCGAISSIFKIYINCIVSDSIISGFGKLRFFKHGVEITNNLATTHIIKGDSVVVFASPDTNCLLDYIGVNDTIIYGSPVKFIMGDEDVLVTTSFSEGTIVFNETFGTSDVLTKPIIGTGAYTGYDNYPSQTFGPISGTTSNSAIHNPAFTNPSDSLSTHLYLQNSNLKIGNLGLISGQVWQLKFKLIPSVNDSLDKLPPLSNIQIEYNNVGTILPYADGTVILQSSDSVILNNAPVVVVNLPSNTQFNWMSFRAPNVTGFTNRARIDDVIIIGISGGAKVPKTLTSVVNSTGSHNISVTSTSNQLRVTGDLLIGSEIEIFSLLSGSKIASKKIVNIPEVLSTFGFPDGVYVVSVKDSKGVYVNIKAIIY